LEDEEGHTFFSSLSSPAVALTSLHGRQPQLCSKSRTPLFPPLLRRLRLHRSSASSLLQVATRIPTLTRALLGRSLELNMAYSCVESYLPWQLLWALTFLQSMQHHLSICFHSPVHVYCKTIFSSPLIKYWPFFLSCRRYFACMPSSTPSPNPFPFLVPTFLCNPYHQ